MERNEFAEQGLEVNLRRGHLVVSGEIVRCRIPGPDGAEHVIEVAAPLEKCLQLAAFADWATTADEDADAVIGIVGRSQRYEVNGVETTVFDGPEIYIPSPGGVGPQHLRARLDKVSFEPLPAQGAGGSTVLALDCTNLQTDMPCRLLFPDLASGRNFLAALARRPGLTEVEFHLNAIGVNPWGTPGRFFVDGASIEIREHASATDKRAAQEIDIGPRFCPIEFKQDAAGRSIGFASMEGNSVRLQGDAARLAASIVAVEGTGGAAGLAGARLMGEWKTVVGTGRVSSIFVANDLRHPSRAIVAGRHVTLEAEIWSGSIVETADAGWISAVPGEALGGGETRCILKGRNLAVLKEIGAEASAAKRRARILIAGYLNDSGSKLYVDSVISNGLVEQQRNTGSRER
jgi:hypothetical protein